MAELQRPRRAPAVERFVSEISKEDIRVKVFGTVTGKEGDLFGLEDSTGKIKIDSPAELEKGKKVIVFGRPAENKGVLEIQAEMVKDAPELNEKLYKKAHLLLNKGGL